MRNKVAVLFTTFNGEKYLKEQLDSVLSQAGVEVIVYISDDMSTDKTKEIVTEYMVNYPNIILLPDDKKFKCAAKNFYRLIRDVELSDFDYVCFADQDDIWNKDKLICSMNKIKEHNVEAYSSSILAFWKSGKEKLIRKDYPQKKYDYLFESAGPGCSYLFKIDTFLNFKEFLTEKWEKCELVDQHDWLVYAYYRSNKHKWFIDSLPSLRYRQHEKNQVGGNVGFSAAIKRLLLMRSGWHLAEARKIANVLEHSPNKIDRKFMLTNLFQLRRRLRDCLVLGVVIVLGIYK